MRRGVSNSYTPGIQDALGISGSAVLQEHAARPAQIPFAHHRSSPLRTEHKHVNHYTISSSDDDSDGIGYDTEDSALRDYMDNVAEHNQGYDFLLRALAESIP
jgi:hypothetical protein